MAVGVIIVDGKSVVDDELVVIVDGKSVINDGLVVIDDGKFVIDDGIGQHRRRKIRHR